MNLRPFLGITTLILLVVLSFPNYSFAAWVATENFDSYTSGVGLNGLNGGSGWGGTWSAGASQTIVSSPTFQGARATLNNSGGQNVSRVLSSAISDSHSILYFSMEMSSASTGDGIFILQSGSNNRVAIKMLGNLSGVIDANSTQILALYTANIWYTFRVTLNTSGNTFTVAYSTASFGGVANWSVESSPISMTTSGNIDTVFLDKDSGSNMYVDNITGTDPFVESSPSSGYFNSFWW